MKRIGIIQRTGLVICYDGNEYQLPQRGNDKEGYPEVLIDATKVGGQGSFVRQSIKSFIGMKVEFSVNPVTLVGYNYKIISI